ncbi:unnamed protein product [Closterium sp. Naga37s-1]|nr:unnamed protein product [Closterium sp. Naga37s-1]
MALLQRALPLSKAVTPNPLPRRLHTVPLLLLLLVFTAAATTTTVADPRLPPLPEDCQRFGYRFCSILRAVSSLTSRVTTTATIQLAVTATGSADNGWFGMCFGKDLRMYPADCIIGNQAGTPIPVGTYNSSSYSSVKLTTAFTIGSKAYTTSGTTATMTFTRTTGDGGVAPVQVRGVNNIIWAYSGSSTTVGSHANKELQHRL